DELHHLAGEVSELRAAQPHVGGTADGADAAVFEALDGPLLVFGEVIGVEEREASHAAECTRARGGSFGIRGRWLWLRGSYQRSRRGLPVFFLATRATRHDAPWHA